MEDFGGKKPAIRVESRPRPLELIRPAETMVTIALQWIQAGLLAHTARRVAATSSRPWDLRLDHSSAMSRNLRQPWVKAVLSKWAAQCRLNDPERRNHPQAQFVPLPIIRWALCQFRFLQSRDSGHEISNVILEKAEWAPCALEH